MDERPADKLHEEKQYPLSHVLGLGAGTLVATGAVDLLAHLGPTGLVIGAIATYVVAKHGPEAMDAVLDNIPTLPGLPTVNNAPAQKRTGRSFLDRAFGRFPEEQAQERDPEQEIQEQEPEIQEQDTEPEGWGIYDQGPDDEVLDLGNAGDMPLRVHINRLLGEGLFVAGNQGSGKSNLAALLLEQLGKCGMPAVIFDLKGEYKTVPQVLRTAVLAGKFEGQGQRVINAENAPQAVEALMHYHLQVIINLASYRDIDEMGVVITAILNALMEFSEQQEDEERIPCFVLWDEAHNFLPENAAMTQMSTEIARDLKRAGFRIVNLGRSYGFTMAFFTQRIANIAKWVVANCQVKVIMRHALDIDLRRCEEEVKSSVANREDIENLPAGQGIVCGLGPRQFIAQFGKRRSRHASHTPKIDRIKRAEIPQQRAVYPPSWKATKVLDNLPEMPPLEAFAILRATEVQQVQPARPLSMEETQQQLLERAIDAWRSGARSVAKLRDTLNVTHHRAYKLYNQINEMNLV